MKTRTPLLLFLLALLSRESCCMDTDPKPMRNITVIGTVFCDACYNNSFTKQSYFLQGARVLVGCNLKSNLKPNEEISFTVDKITDRFGVYKLEFPPIDGFDCAEGREPDSFCHATLISSSSPLCDVPSIKSSAEHVALKNTEVNACLFNLNALSYRPAKRDATLCGTETKRTQMDNSLFFWPPFPPFGFPWPHWPPFPFPFQSPPSLPFPFPTIPFFTPPPSFPFPLPPLWPTPSPPPSLPFPFPPLPPVPSLFPSPPPPPSFPFPLPPFTPIPLPPLTPIPSLFPPPPPPPPPPAPSFPFLPPLPPLFPTPNPPQAPSPPPAFSLTDPRTWFPYRPPSSPTQPHNHDP